MYAPPSFELIGIGGMTILILVFQPETRGKFKNLISVMFISIEDDLIGNERISP